MLLAAVSSNLVLYWTLKLILVGLFFLFGIWYQKGYYTISKQQFWLFAGFVIVYYTLFEGLRWDRGVDYYQYMLEFTGKWKAQNRELLYRGLLWTIQRFDIPFFVVFSLLSMTFVTAVISTLKNFPWFFCWSLLAMYFMTDYAQENLVRQFIGLSVFLFAFSAYFQGKEKWMFACLIMAPMFHSSGWFGSAVFLGLWYLTDKAPVIKSPIPIIITYLLISLLWDISQLSFITEYANSLNVSEESQFSGYINNADRWLGKEGSLNALNSVHEGQTAMTKLITLAFNTIVLYFGFEVKQLDGRLCIPYWMCVFSVFIGVIGGDIELYGRMNWWMKIITPVIFGAVLAYPLYKPATRLIVIGVYLMYYIYPFLKSIGVSPYSGHAFVWDLGLI